MNAARPPEEPPPNRVLVVDDTARDRKLLRARLEELGFEVLEASDGIHALEVLRETPVDAVVSDILMPRLDGYRLCAEVRRNPQLAGLRYVLHTSSYTSPADEKLAYRFGVDVFLRKPAQSGVLAAALREPSRASPGSAEGNAEAEKLEVLHHYSDALVRKLEEKNAELEATADRLQAANQELLQRTRELERVQAELQRLNDELESRVRQRTAQLETVNSELEQFSGAVAHDLRAPIRALQGYAAILASQCSHLINEECKGYLRRIPDTAKRMADLVDDLMLLSKVSRAQLRRTRTDLSEIARAVVAQLRSQTPSRTVNVTIAPGIAANCDGPLLKIVLENLLGNAWKFTSRQPQAAIEFGLVRAEEPVIFVRDNGAGFDMAFASRLFTAFNRLHSPSEFPGTGIGLATVKRIIDRHGGRIWAEAAEGRGATFSFTLPQK